MLHRIKVDDLDKGMADTQAAGFKIVEVHNQIDGKFIVYDDGIPEATPRNALKELDALKIELKAKGVI